MSLPKRLDNVVDEIGTGAIIRHRIGNYNAVIVDYLSTGKEYDGNFVAARLLRERDGEPAMTHYEMFLVQDESEWMLLTLGTDHDLQVDE